MRLISICPSNTELLAYLGLESSLIAVDDYSDWPKSVHQLPKLGPDLSIDMDKVEQLNPDLVLASLSVPGMEKNITELERRNIPHIILNPQSLEDIADDILLVGEHTNTRLKAAEVAERYRKFITTYKMISKEIVNKPSFYWEWWPKPIFTPGGINWLTEISTLAGVRNIFEDKQVASYQTDWEEIQTLNPDHIGLVWVGIEQDKMKPELVKKRPGSDSMNAIIHNRIHVLDEPLYCRPSPRLLLGLKKLGSLIHPTIYPDNDGIDPLLVDRLS
ncbi:cobalamin-binding protein [Bacillus suaedaesalsae]|uniref:Cobalamin-binding protein n=1 Tax=Bacillus suaedaesalsae TaxID=2810349 RepID=A0ABS2DJM8_9BACI|nr:cobalamin-binding protein [Bacillus suaedaesalsae]MBM6618700.1 cobalamin-binding protein [Bacillus suaedaesalsae]